MIRGRLRSREIENVVREARELASNGVKELILVAQDTTLYGTDIYGRPALPELLEQLCTIDGLKWIRLLYCYPEHITDRLLEVMAAQDKIVKYMDIPIQHASGRVLGAMNRPGDGQTLRRVIEKIRKAVPGIVLRTTVMTGFPGEGQEEFAELCEFIRDMRFARLGCFAFSPEEGTAAAAMPNQVDEKEKRRRRDIIMQEQSLISGEINHSQIGKTMDILIESYDRYADAGLDAAQQTRDIDGKVFITRAR